MIKRIKISRRIADHLIQVIVILASVFIAFVLNEWRLDARENKLRNDALYHVKNEIEQNLVVIEKWLPYHTDVLRNIERAIQNPVSRDSLITAYGVNMFPLAPKGILNDLISRSAWQFLLQNQIQLELELSRILNATYTLQENYYMEGINSLMQFVQSREVSRSELIDETLYVFYQLMNEQVGRGQFLKLHYQDALAALAFIN